MKRHWTSALVRLGACDDAVEWAKGYATLADAWRACERADWMLWLAARTAGRKTAVRLACICARTALQYVPTGELRPLRAIETTEAWCEGRATTVEEVRAAAYAANAEADAAAYAVADAVAYAAYAAANAANAAAYAVADAAAYAAANAANAAADAAAYAADAADAAAYAVDRPRALRNMSDMIRTEHPDPPLVAQTKGGAA